MFAHGLSKRSAVLLAAFVTLLTSLPWLWLLGGALVPVGVQDRCLARTVRQYGNDATLAGDPYIRWFPPAWVCPMRDGHLVLLTISNN